MQHWQVEYGLLRFHTLQLHWRDGLRLHCCWRFVMPRECGGYLGWGTQPDSHTIFRHFTGFCTSHIRLVQFQDGSCFRHIVRYIRQFGSVSAGGYFRYVIPVG